MHCVHRREPLGSVQTPYGFLGHYRCAHERHPEATARECLRCADFMPRSSAESAAATPLPTAARHPLGVVVTRDGRDAGLADLYRGASGFLVLGGPSLKTLPLELLGRRGLVILSYNNNAAPLPPPLRPHVWLHNDGSAKFAAGWWLDPAVIKLSPVKTWDKENPRNKAGKFAYGIRRRDEAGNLAAIEGLRPKQCPGVLGFLRNAKFVPETFLTEPSFNEGNSKKHGNPEWPQIINTMPTAIRLAYFLGLKTLYLIGADFRMEPQEPYAFDQGKSRGGVQANNAAFAKLCAMYDALLPHFAAAGFAVYNCTPDSRLWSFPEIPFAAAVEQATAGVEQTINPKGMYDD